MTRCLLEFFIFFPLRFEIYLQLKSHYVNQFLIWRGLWLEGRPFTLSCRNTTKKNRLQKTIFHKKSLTKIVSAFRIENLGKFTF